MSKVVVDAFTTVVAAVNADYSGDVYSMYGNKIEIANRLLEKDSDMVYKYQKYPLIALHMPFTEGIKADGMIELSLNIAIMDFTEETYISEERYQQVFVPILEPLYELLLEKIQESGLFNIIGTPEHTRIDRLFWGTENQIGSNEQDKYVFNDPLDAIELVNLKLNLLESKC